MRMIDIDINWYYLFKRMNCKSHGLKEKEDWRRIGQKEKEIALSDHTCSLTSGTRILLILVLPYTK